MKMRTVKCVDCGREVDARSHNMKAHRATHRQGGSCPLKRVMELFETVFERERMGSVKRET